MRNDLAPLLLLALLPGTVIAQGRAADPFPAAATPIGTEDSAAGPSLGLRHLAVGLGAVALLSLADEPLRDELQGHRSTGGDDLARTVRHFGEPVVYAPVVLGTVAVGLISGKPSVTRAGGRMAGGLLVAGLATSLLKPILGRRRPRYTDDVYDFSPLTGRDSWPSGHTTMAFALATSVSDEVGSLPVTIGLYGAATLTGWSRMNDNRHWLSDVAAGAAIGVASAKLMNGRWRVFGLGAPHFLLEPDRAGLSFQF